MMNAEPTIQMIAIELIMPNRFQPRLTFDEQGLNELAASIKEHGIIQPLVLRKLGDKYEIIAGERRYKAATIAGLAEVPAIIAELDDNQSAEIALIENVQRRDLTSIEEAKSYQKILDKGYLTQEQLAKRMGIAQSTVANKLRLLNLVDDVQEALMNEKISERHARSLLQLTNPEEQRQMLTRIISERLTVRQLDEELKKRTSSAPTTEAVIEEIQEEAPLTSEAAEKLINILTEADPVSTTVSEPIEQLSVDPVSAPEILEPVIEEVQIETLDLEPATEPNIDDIKANATDIITKPADKVLNIFDQPTYPSLEDEIVNMETTVGDSPSFNPFNVEDLEYMPGSKKENVKEPGSDLKTPELTATSIIASSDEPVAEPEKRIKPNNLDSVSVAFKELEKEITESGYKISTEEFDFEDLYQIIIKIDKQAE